MTFDEITKHLLEDKSPSRYFEEKIKSGEIHKTPLKELIKLRDTEQELEHHPEGNVWNHTMLVVDNGAEIREESKDKKVFMWALLLHDIGKVKTTKKRNGKWTAYEHDTVGEEEATKILREFTKDEDFIKKVTGLIRYHMHYLYITKNLPFADVEGMKKSCNIDELKLVFTSDRLGRGNLKSEEKEEIKKTVKTFKI